MNQLPLVGGSNHGHWTSVSEQSLRNGRIFVLVKEGCGRIEKYELKLMMLLRGRLSLTPNRKELEPTLNTE